MKTLKECAMTVEAKECVAFADWLWRNVDEKEMSHKTWKELYDLFHVSMINYVHVDIAQVIIGSDDNLSIYKWVRTNIGLGIKESKELVDGKIIDFNGNAKQALEFYEYVNNCNETTAILNIKKASKPYTNTLGVNCVSLKDMDEDKLFNNEILSLNKTNELARNELISMNSYQYDFMRYYNIRIT